MLFRYEDFYVAQNKKTNKKPKQFHGSDDWDAEDEQEDNKVFNNILFYSLFV